MTKALILLSTVVFVGVAAAFQIVDSAGRVVGDASGAITRDPDTGDLTANTTLRRTVTGQIVSLTVSRKAIYPTAAIRGLFYDTADCSGPAFVTVDAAIGSSVCIDGPASDQPCYVALEPIETRPLAYVRSTNSCPTGTPDAHGLWCCPNSGYGFPRETGPAGSLDLTVFTPPFSVQ